MEVEEGETTVDWKILIDAQMMSPEMAQKLAEQQTEQQVEKLGFQRRQKRPVQQSEMQPISTWEEMKLDNSKS